MNPSILRNLTSEQWELLSKLVPPAKKGGRKRSIEMQAVVNAIMYILCADCAWRMLPNDFHLLENCLSLRRQWRY